MKYFAMRGSQDINKNWPLCNSICFKFFSKEIWAPDCTAQCYLQESQIYLDTWRIFWKSVFTKHLCESKSAAYGNDLGSTWYCLCWLALCLCFHPGECFSLSPAFGKRVILLLHFQAQVCPRSSSSLEPFQKPFRPLPWAADLLQISPARVAWNDGLLCKGALDSAKRVPTRCTLKRRSYLKFLTSCLFQLGQPRSQPGQYSKKQGRGREQIWPQDCR